MKRIFYSLLSLATITGLVFTGCDTTETGLDDTTTLSIQMRAAPNADQARQINTANQASAAIVQEVKLFVEELELDGTNGTRDFELEDFIINLPVDGSPVVLIETEIPAGLYDEFEFEIEDPGDDIEIDDPDLRDETGSYSLVVKGTYDGEEFRFRTDEEIEVEFDLSPPLEIAEGDNAALIISVDVASWFIGPDGEELDPNDPGNEETIISNIKNSIRVNPE
jgi:hypothetical protein